MPPPEPDAERCNAWSSWPHSGDASNRASSCASSDPGAVGPGVMGDSALARGAFFTLPCPRLLGLRAVEGAIVAAGDSSMDARLRLVMLSAGVTAVCGVVIAGMVCAMSSRHRRSTAAPSRGHAATELFGSAAS